MTVAQRLFEIGEQIEHDFALREDELLQRIHELERQLREQSRTIEHLQNNPSSDDRDEGEEVFMYSSLPVLPYEVVEECVEHCKESGDFVQVLSEYPRLQVEIPFLKLFSVESLCSLMSDLPPKDLQYIFQEATRRGAVEIMEVTLKVWNRRLLDPPKPSHLSPLFLACENGHSSAVRWLITLGINIKSIDVVQAAISAGPETIEALLLNVAPRELPRLFEGVAPTDLPRSISAALVIGLSHLGNDKYRSGKFKEAAADYRSALEISDSLPSSDKVKLLYNLGRASYRQGQWLQALDYLCQCIDLSPNYLPAYAQRGYCQIALLAWDQAAKEFALGAQMASACPECGGGPLLARSPCSSCGGLTASVFESKRALCLSVAATDHYTVLGLPQLRASESEIKTSFREAARRVHPDKLHVQLSTMAPGTACEASLHARACNLFSKIQAAYSCLSDPVKKREYDLCLRLEKVSVGRISRTWSSGSFDRPAGDCSWFTATPPQSPTKQFNSMLRPDSPLTRTKGTFWTAEDEDEPAGGIGVRE